MKSGSMGEKIPEQLIIRYLANEASPEEQQELLEWVSREIKNQKIFQEYIEIWERKNPAARSYDPDKGLQRLNYKIDLIENEEKEIKLFPWSKVAAAVTLLIVASVVIMVSREFIFEQKPITYIEEATNSAEKRTLRLSDGSIIQLNSKTSLKYPSEFVNNTREVYLTGEAFFSVKKDPAKPFIIHTGNLTTEVLGTSFNINVLSESINITVATGKVKVSDRNQTGIVLPGDKIMYHLATATLEKQRAVIDKELAWLKNTIIFDDTPIGAAATILENWYGVRIIFSDDAVKKCVITGTFKNESLEHVLDAIAFSTDIQYKILNKKVTLSGKGCE